MNIISALNARAGYVFYFLTWLIVGGIAALWWVPSFMGEPKPIPWNFGAICLVGQWVFVFNHWPRLGTRRFFRESRFIRIEIFLLVLVSASFALGFALAA